MGVVSDCVYTQNMGGNANATQNILRNFNTVSLLYKVGSLLCYSIDAKSVLVNF